MKPVKDMTDEEKLFIEYCKLQETKRYLLGAKGILINITEPKDEKNENQPKK